MKAILLAGGKGTRLRPLTIHTPKPIVPIFNRPFLHYQLDLLKQVPEIDEVILSLNYQPRRIEEIFGEGEGLGIRLRYVVEPMPLGTGGAIRYAGDSLSESVVVFNGDVLTEVDLAAVLRSHLFPLAVRARRDLRRVHLRWVLDRHWHAGEILAGPPRYHGRSLLRSTVQQQPGASWLTRIRGQPRSIRIRNARAPRLRPRVDLSRRADRAWRGVARAV